MLPDLQVSDTVRLRKPHPCGSYEWKVVRLGADIGIECLGCNRRVILPRRQLARRVKTIVHAGGHDRSIGSQQLSGVETAIPDQVEEFTERSDDPSPN